MCIKNRLVSLIFKLILTGACFMGLYLNSGAPEGQFSFDMFNYFTILSNVLVFVVFFVLIVRTIGDIKRAGVHGTTSIAPFFKGAATMAITVTFLVYHFMLAPQSFSMNGSSGIFNFANIIVHYVVPIMTLADWLLFDPKGAFRLRDPVLWLSLPLAYFVFTIIRAQIGGILPGKTSRYPYFFIDIDLYGWSVAGYVVALAVFFLILGYIIFFIDKLLGYHRQKKDLLQR